MFVCCDIQIIRGCGSRSDGMEVYVESARWIFEQSFVFFIIFFCFFYFIFVWSAKIGCDPGLSGLQ